LVVSAVVGNVIPAIAWFGQCVDVIDGDTITVMKGDKPVKVRLYGVDTPEKHQQWATEATKFTTNMVYQKQVSVLPVSTDKYGRTIGRVTVNGKSLELGLLEAGLAFWYRKYALEVVGYGVMEKVACMKRQGVWSQVMDDKVCGCVAEIGEGPAPTDYGDDSALLGMGGR
jgi:endonuclease YncB( thermonuclease family)